MTLQIISRSKIWFALSTAIVVVSVVFLVAFGIRPGIDFTGGVLMSLDFATDVAQEPLRERLITAGHEPVVQITEDGSAIVRMESLSEEQHQALLTDLRATFGDLTETQYTAIDPLIGRELTRQAVIAIVLVLVLIAAYIVWAFRKVSEPVVSWKYGLVTLVAAFHDIIVPLGVFAFLSHFFGYEADTAFVAALLTILGYSINDTIVVFDRTRENLHRNRHNAESFADTVNRSVNETLARSLNTTLCVLLPVLAIVIFGGESTRPFSVTLLVGILAGAYSSIFVASPMLVLSEKWGKR